MRAKILMLAGVLVPTLGWALGPGADGVGPTSASSVSAVPDRKQVSYAIGYRIGADFAAGKPEVDLPTLIQAIRDAHAGRAPSVPVAAMDHQLMLLGAHMRRQAESAFHRQAEENAASSRRFLKANAQKPGVVTLPSGVQYRVLSRGSGPVPAANSTVKINYRGALANGMEFDSSWAHGKPVTYAVHDMLPGWRDVLPRMHVGARWEVVIPPERAYGEHGQLPRIGPNEVLVFDIQLLDVLQ